MESFQEKEMGSLVGRHGEQTYTVHRSYDMLGRRGSARKLTLPGVVLFSSKIEGFFKGEYLAKKKHGIPQNSYQTLIIA